jgi:hypothetical protein
MNEFDIELKKYFEAKDKLAIFYISKKYETLIKLIAIAILVYLGLAAS